MQKGSLYMNYGLWLLSDENGRITLTGWSETGSDITDPNATTRTDHWPSYPLCDDRAQLPARLQELGLDLAPGADLNDLDRAWDVYVRHADLAALRAALDPPKDRPLITPPAAAPPRASRRCHDGLSRGSSPTTQ